RDPGARVRPAEADAGGAAREVRLPARRARDGRTAPRRDRVRDRPHADGAGPGAEPARHDRLPEEPGGRRPDDRRADGGDAGTAARARNPVGREELTAAYAPADARVILTASTPKEAGSSMAAQEPGQVASPLTPLPSIDDLPANGEGYDR